jgi:hypothetical protein
MPITQRHGTQPSAAQHSFGPQQLPSQQSRPSAQHPSPQASYPSSQLSPQTPPTQTPVACAVPWQRLSQAPQLFTSVDVSAQPVRQADG